MDRILKPNTITDGISSDIQTDLLASDTCTIKDEGPKFTKKKINLNIPEQITHLTVSNNHLVCLMSHHVLLRLFLENPIHQDEVFLEQYMGGYSVMNIFFDPSGNHLIIPLSPKSTGLQPELLYLHKTNDKPKRIDKYRDHEITAVAFNHNDSNEKTTGQILFGTSKGIILATEFGIDGTRPYNNNWKQVFAIPTSSPPSPPAITGLEFFKAYNSESYIVLVSTPNKIYKFQETFKSDEKLVLQNIFTQYVNVGEDSLRFAMSTPDGKFSKLALNCDVKEKYPKHMAWLTENNIFYAKIDPEAKSCEFVVDQDIINFPEESKKSPKALVLSDFHVIFMYPDHISVVNTLNHSVVHEKYFAEQSSPLQNIIKDFNTEIIYVYTSKSIFRFQIRNEQDNIWKIYLEKNEFELAEKYAEYNRTYLDIVLCQKAEKYFFEKNYIESAKIFSDTEISFEKVCLKFLELEDKKPLMIYLQNKFNQLDKQDIMQITLLTIWLIELHLERISNSNLNTDEEQAALDLFMSNDRVKEYCRKNYSVIYDLFALHGDKYNLTNLTIVNNDYESVINQFLNENNLLKVLETIKLQKKPDLFYKYCPILMEDYPKETIQAIIDQNKTLNPEKLIPTLICINTEEHIIEIIKYLEFAIHHLHVPNKSIHNYLIKLLALQNQEEKLLDYLKIQDIDLLHIQYEINYALKVCEQHKLKKASVFLQCNLELWESAVELALTFDINLAQNIASRPKDDDRKKKLWLEIAKHEIKRNADVREPLKLLQKCDLLKIEDILPLFEDFTKIDDFKVPICNALKEYNLELQELQHDMDEAGKAAERVNESLQSLRDRSIRISSQDICSVCEHILLTQPFFLFPCGHKFHSDCLEKQIIPYLNKEENRRLISLKSQLDNLATATIVTNQYNKTNSSNQESSNNSRDKIKTQIENILAADCLYCGVMIDSIDKLFFEESDWDRVNTDWD